VTPCSDRPVNIVGAGLAGALLAVMLARRGFAVDVHDRRPDPRLAESERGRSINLALAARGIAALEHAGVTERIRPLLIPMRGRMIHSLSGETQLQPYGQRQEEVIYSVSRAWLLYRRQARCDSAMRVRAASAMCRLQRPSPPMAPDRPFARVSRARD
jgi:kynurenine 3-monooxygenase